MMTFSVVHLPTCIW